jgi:hypothetical protein
MWIQNSRHVHAVHSAQYMLYTQPCICCTLSPVYAVHSALYIPYTQPCICCTLSPVNALHTALYLIECYLTILPLAKII